MIRSQQAYIHTFLSAQSFKRRRVMQMMELISKVFKSQSYFAHRGHELSQ
jgi:hypothetical protein